MKKLLLSVAVACACALPSLALLKGIHPAITPDMLKALAEMGHGDEVVVGDANFPAHAVHTRVIHAEGSSASDILKGISGLMDLDTYATPVVMMAPLPHDTLDPNVEKKYREALGGYTGKVERISRTDFYARAKSSIFVIVTGETAKYGNIILKKASVVPDSGAKKK